MIKVSISPMTSKYSHSLKHSNVQHKTSPLPKIIKNENETMQLLLSKSIALAEIDLEYNDEIKQQNLHQLKLNKDESLFDDSYIFSTNIIESLRAQNEIKALVNSF